MMKSAIIYPLITSVLLINGSFSCYSQNQRALVGTCEGCEAVFEFGTKELQSIDTLPGYKDSANALKIYGKVYLPDEKTPASDVVLYLYQTNEEGIYPKKGNEQGWGRRHGYIREWIKTDKDGNYAFYTFRPGTYPSRTEPAHIHLTILEPNGRYYWLDSYLFEDDPLLSVNEESKNPRGGLSGILSMKMEKGIQTGKRDIILGKNIPGYD